MRHSAKYSTSNPLVKTTHGDKSLCIDPYIGFYETKDGDNTKEVEDA